MLIARLPRHETLALAPLTFAQFHDAIEGVAGPRTDSLARFLHERSGGHAFFAAQLFESLVHDARRCATTRTPSFSTCRSTGSKRRSRFGISSRAVYSRAATIPRRSHARSRWNAAATAEDLTAACGIGEDRTLDAIDDLLALGIIEQPASGPQFRFEHDIVRENRGAFAQQRAGVQKSIGRSRPSSNTTNAARRRCSARGICERAAKLRRRRRHIARRHTDIWKSTRGGMRSNPR